MKKSFADKLVCPVDKSELKLQVFATNTDQEIIEGLFTCPTCKRYYPVIYGLPIMSPDEYRQFHLEQPMLEKWGHQISNGTPTPKFLLEDK
ncbi:Trm112 family protein [Parasediminibacterium sp. JCM 36343]|uniref:Trm112 family protein n=1 Tax=Parasediminibacterium sp. JCM 36343 TaxID=3374279 RepID=UPI00397A04A6